MEYVRTAADDKKSHVVIYTDSSTTIYMNSTISSGEKFTKFSKVGKDHHARGATDRLAAGNIELTQSSMGGDSVGVKADSISIIANDIPSRSINDNPNGDIPGSRIDSSEVLGHELAHGVDFQGAFNKHEGHNKLFDRQSKAARDEDQQTYDKKQRDDYYKKK